MTARSTDRKGLGRGLSALMADVSITPGADPATTPARDSVRTLPIEQVQPNPQQPRRHFSPEALQELTVSIREKGILQPLIVRPEPDGSEKFQIVAGERRWRAAQAAQLHTVPVIVRELDDTEVLEVSIIENIQRADLNALEEALAYRQLMDRFGHTQDAMAQALGKSRSHIANTLRLLSLPDEVQTLLRDGKLSAGHARTLIGAESPLPLAEKIVREGLSVRAAEKLTRKTGTPPRQKQPRYMIPGSDADTREMEHDLSAQIGLKVKIDHTAGTQAGRVVVRYDTLDQLDVIISALSLRAQKIR